MKEYRLKLISHNKLIWIVMLWVLIFGASILTLSATTRTRNDIIGLILLTVFIALSFLCRKFVIKKVEYQCSISISPHYFLINGDIKKNQWQNIRWHKIGSSKANNNITLKMKNGETFKFCIIDKFLSQKEVDVWREFQNQIIAKILTRSSSQNYYKSKKIGATIILFFIAYSLLMLGFIFTPDLIKSQLPQLLIFFGATMPYLSYIINKRKKSI